MTPTMRTTVLIPIVMFITIVLSILSNRYLGFISDHRLSGLFLIKNGQSSTRLQVLLQTVDQRRPNTDGDTCSNLLDDGYLLDNVTWQPRGCRMHTYTPREVYTCFERIENDNRTNNLVFLGDSRVLYLFEQLYGFIQFDSQYSLFKLNKTKITFTWNKYIDDTLTNHFKVWTDPANEKPTLLVTNSCLWYLRHDVDRSDEAKAPVVDNITCKYKNGSKVYCNYMVNKFNKVFEDTLFGRSSVRLWHTYRKIGESFKDEMTDGLHFKAKGLAMVYHMQILWNYYCNDVMDLPEGTCCGKSKSKHQENRIFQFSNHSQVWYRYVQRAVDPYLILLFGSFLVICAVCTSALSKKLNFNTSKYNIIRQ